MTAATTAATTATTTAATTATTATTTVTTTTTTAATTTTSGRSARRRIRLQVLSPPPPPPLRHRRRRLTPSSSSSYLQRWAVPFVSLCFSLFLLWFPLGLVGCCSTYDYWDHTNLLFSPLLLPSKDPMNEDCANKIREIDVRTKSQLALAKKGAKEVDDLFSYVFGKEKHGRVRGLGLGPAPTHIWTDAPSPATCIRIATEARKKSEEETKEMKERMIVMETQLVEMKAMMATILQNKSTDFQQSNYTPTNPLDGRQNIVDANNPNDAFEGEVRSSSSNHQFQSYQVHQTKKRRVRYEHETENNPERGEKEVLLMSLGQPHRPVARGLLFSTNPSTIVGGERLGHQYWEIYVEVVMIPTESLIRSYQGMKMICDAARKNIAWPSYLVKPVKMLN